MSVFADVVVQTLTETERSWCEYHDGCEWREMKSQEVRRRAEEKAQQARG